MTDEMRGMTMPRMMYGTAWKKERTAELVLQALRAGFRGIDTACQPKHYREDLVGEAVHQAIAAGLVKRDELFIQTKFTSIDGQDTSQPLPYDPSLPVPSQVTSSIARSLSNLRVEYIDSVILHSPLRTKADTLAAYRVLEAHVQAGQIRQIGVSNCYDVKTLQWLQGEATVKMGVVQNRWYEGNGWDWGVVDWCKANGVRYQSFWTLTGSPSLLSHPLLRNIASHHHLTPEQTVYRLCQIWGITPLCGSKTLERVEQALAVEQAEITMETRGVRELWQAMRGE